VFRVNRLRRQEGYCSLPGVPCDVLLDGFRRHNRAVEGDRVALQLDEPHAWPLQKGLAPEAGPQRGAAGPDGDAAGGTPSPSPSSSAAAPPLSSSAGPKAPAPSSADSQAAGAPKVDEAESMVDFLASRMAGTRLEGGAAALSAEEIARIVRDTGRRPTGKVVAVLEPSKRRERLVGFLSRPGGKEGSQGKSRDTVWFVPLDKRMPKLIVYARTIPVEALPGGQPDPALLVKASISEWKAQHPFPAGEVHDVLGDAGLVETQTAAILFQEGITHTHGDEFSPEVLACLPQGEWHITPEEVEKRRDLREWRIFSIDPPTARDLDDALSVRPLGDGLVEVGVHIADVSHFVAHGTALDQEAAVRATSVYLVQRVLPMLPRLLCEQLCSLNAGVDRLAFSVIWTLDTRDCSVRSQWMGKSVIRSCAKLHYGHAQRVIEGDLGEFDPPVELSNGMREEDVKKDVLLLHGLAQTLRRQRFDAGALRLDNAKLSFEFDEDGHPLAATVYEQKEANRLVEEFMLLANRCVARAIAEACPALAVLRRHPEPDERKLQETLKTMQQLGHSLDARSSGSMHRSLQGIIARTGPEVGRAMMLLCTKPMQLAEYFCTGDPAFEGNEALWRHYALAFEHYTHFTSPIRRYPDILVHRTLAAILAPDGQPRPELPVAPTEEETLQGQKRVAFCKQCNEQKLAAKNAQDNSMKLYFAIMLKYRPAKATALVTSVNGPKWFDVFVVEFGLEARVWVEDMLGVEARYNPDRCELQLASRGGGRAADGAKHAYELGTGALPLEISQLTRLEVVLHGREDQQGRKIEVAAQLVGLAG